MSTSRRKAVMPAAAITSPERPSRIPGEVDVWPILRQPAGALVAQVAEGVHDDLVPLLLPLAISQHLPQQVIEALRARVH
jgi:hypothetical protein